MLLAPAFSIDLSQQDHAQEYAQRAENKQSFVTDPGAGPDRVQSIQRGTFEARAGSQTGRR